MSHLHYSKLHYLKYYSFCVETSDFEFTPISVINSAAVRLFATNDKITLEYDDTVTLLFIPTNEDLASALEDVGEYIRTTSTVTIVDNDSRFYK